ncbi:MAG: hypothetical protein QY332_10380 [Anaerolineales bacterium]|nr:MAG: hypothetical protein QY332_10380 [Anaerolineales bacterium]
MNTRIAWFITIVAITATISMAFVAYLSRGQADWIQALLFGMLFSAVFGFLWWKRESQRKE